ncbi:hypothetical protein [Rhizobium grahamii]|uniref:Uncharacterized protein n=2 Tax=Rhizobium grahamii TaxID=1120045 RepID=S3I5P2_9HYPH|nr:hypothetical protein [Rhizobium grahamii]EPE94848.1 hypothetical protein RGCCGE502_30118 [Rhizobium grahamii CCGE 502]RDJ05633.1 hypothetical protein B5K06_24580 [Rhizobium grahamii]
MPANFDSPLTINGGTGFVQWPTGPLGSVDGYKPIRVEVWLMQQSTGAIQMTYQDEFIPGVTTWKADDPYFPPSGSLSGGLFKPGAALGTAVLITKKMGGTVQHVYWWTEEVDLKY